MADFDTDSDSENEGGQGNVTRVVMRPPGHSGKAKRGHLCFDASFESGNLGHVDLISEYEYDLYVRPDTCNPRLRLWYNFVVDNIRADQRVIFNIVNFSKNRNLYREGMTPIVKSTSRPKWQRMPNKHVHYYRSPQHQNHYVLSFAFGFDREEDVYQFAFSYPYSYSRCQAHLELLERRQLLFLKRQLIAHSVQQRRLDMLTITQPENNKPDKKKRVVVILSRIHPGESPTSYVCQGLIDFLISSHPIAIALRQYIVFKIIPMMNPDGVFLGNYRSSLMGFDLNRTWNQISKWAHPTLDAVHNLLIEMDNDTNIDLDFVLDIHAHTNLNGVFIYGNTYEDVYRYERHIVFPKILAHNAEDYSLANTMYNRDPAKLGTTRRYFCDNLKDTVNCYTLEVSFYGYQRKDCPGVTLYTEESYYRLGRNLARTYLDYYKSIGLVPTTLPTTISQVPDRRIRSRSRSRIRSGRRVPSRPQTAFSLRKHAWTHRSTSSGSECSGVLRTANSTSPLASRRRGHLILQFPQAGGQSGDNSKRFQAVPCRKMGADVESRVTLLGIGGMKNLAGRKVGGGGSVSRTYVGAITGIPARIPNLVTSPPTPSLSIIDFNRLARGGLDLATGRGGRTRGKDREGKVNKRNPLSADKQENRAVQSTSFRRLHPTKSGKEKR